ncbi:unnamed protein product, partial [Polarella glacialis]
MCDFACREQVIPSSKERSCLNRLLGWRGDSTDTIWEEAQGAQEDDLEEITRGSKEETLVRKFQRESGFDTTSLLGSSVISMESIEQHVPLDR